MQVVATSLVAEHIGPLIEAFSARDDGVEIAIESVPGDSFADLLDHRRADIALGPASGPERSATIASVPFLRCRMIVAAAPCASARRAARRSAPAELGGERWLVGPPDLDPTTADRPVLRAQRARARATSPTYTSHAGGDRGGGRRGGRSS